MHSRRVLWGAVLAAICLFDVSRAANITNPDWVVKPTSDQLGQAYPEIADWLELAGRAVISCRVTAAGILDACKTLAEAPAELGFGDAALSMTPYFRMRPKVVDGRPVSDGTVRIPIAFKLPPPAAPPATPPPRSQQSIELAKILLTRGGMMRDATTVAALKAQVISNVSAPGVSDATRKAAAAAMSSAIKALLPQLVDAVAAVVAANLTDGELSDLTSAARAGGLAAWKSANEKAAGDGYLMTEADKIARRFAREDFCRKHSCHVATEAEFALSAPSGAPAPSISEPDWIESPTEAQINTAAAPLAKALQIDGRARLICFVAPQGLLDRCSVSDESPEQLGLGSAALKVTRYYRLAPELMAQGAQGETVSVAVHFPGRQRPEMKLRDAPPNKIALARQIVASSVFEADIKLGFEGRIGTLEGVPVGDVAPSVRGEIVAGYREGARQALANVTELRANTYAMLLSEQELTALLDFTRSRGGQGLLRARSKLDKQTSGLFQAFDRLLARKAGEAFCKTRACDLQFPELPPEPS